MCASLSYIIHSLYHTYLFGLCGLSLFCACVYLVDGIYKLVDDTDLPQQKHYEAATS